MDTRGTGRESSVVCPPDRTAIGLTVEIRPRCELETQVCNVVYSHASYLITLQESCGLRAIGGGWSLYTSTTEFTAAWHTATLINHVKICTGAEMVTI